MIKLLQAEDIYREGSMRKMMLAILGIASILASCMGKKCHPTACEHTYKCSESEELPVPVKRHNRW